MQISDSGPARSTHFLLFGGSRTYRFPQQNKGFPTPRNPIRKKQFSQWFWAPFLSLFAQRALKPFINASVYKVFRTTFFDVADCCFPNGKTTFADVAKAQQVLLENVMLSGVLFPLFNKRHPKVFINHSVYTGF